MQVSGPASERGTKHANTRSANRFYPIYLREITWVHSGQNRGQEMLALPFKRIGLDRVSRSSRKKKLVVNTTRTEAAFSGSYAPRSSDLPGFSSTSLSFLLIGAVLRIICFFFSCNDGGDAVSRAVGTAIWLQHKDWHLDAFGPYLPLHFWLMALPSSLLGNVLIGTRILSLVLGIASLYFLWLSAYELFDGTAADYSLILYAFYSLHVGYSTTSSSEVPYLFFLLVGLALLFRFRRTGRFGLLILSGLAVTCAAAIRYEAWVLILAIGLSLLWPLTRILRRTFWRLSELQPVLVFAAAAAVWPVIFMIYCWMKFRDPVHYLTAQKAWTAEIGTFAQHSFLYILTFHPGVMLITLSPFGIAAILYGLWVARHDGPPVRDYFVIVLAFTIVQFYDLISGATWPSARYSMTLATLLALAGGYGVKTLLAKTSGQFRTAVVTVFIGGLIANFALVLLFSQMNWRFADKFRSVSPLVQYPTHVQEVSKFLKAAMSQDSAIVIDNYNCESGIIARAIDLPLPPGNRAFLTSARIHSYECDAPGGFSAGEITAQQQDLHEFIKLHQPEYVVYYPLGSLRPYLPLTSCSDAPIDLDGAKYRCVYSGQIYEVFRVAY